MRIVKPSVTLDGPLDGAKILRDVEWVARHCYKSEDLICDGSATKLVGNFLQNTPPHLAMLDHVTIRAVFVVDRGITHEIVRHRIGVAYAQESTRYCNYSKGKFDNQISVIQPPGLEGADLRDWVNSCEAAEAYYLRMIGRGVKPQIARSVLPTCLKAELVVTANVTAWRHIFNMRTGKAPHPQMRQVMSPLLAYVQAKVPIVFDNLPADPLPEGLEPALVTEVERG